jgi:citrate synthase
VPGRINTADAAARLGVKRETLYAYVSRGLLASERGVEGKGSTFDAAEIDRFRRRRNERRPGRLEVAVGSAITDVTDGDVAYRRHSLADIVATGHRYEEVAELLWTGVLAGTRPWTTSPAVDSAVRRVVAALPDNATATDKMMAGVVAAGAVDPFRDDRTLEGVVGIGRGLIRSIVDALPVVVEVDDDQLAHRLWGRLTTESPGSWPLLDLALTVLADHGMATSTLAARLAASTRAGPHSVLLAALGAVAGPLHGAASRRVHLMLVDAESHGIDAAIAQVMRRDGKVPGVGHFIHKTRDPRHDLLAERLATSDLDEGRLAVIGGVGARIAARVPVPPNVDFALGALTYASGMSADAGELVFAIARSAGWLAHCLEEYDEAPIRFRPVGRYRSR